MGHDADVLDQVFLAQQCFGDGALETELLLLYAATTRELLAAMGAMAPQALREAAHRLVGSSRGIGAWSVARAARAVENAGPDGRDAALDRLATAFAETEMAIRARLAAG